MSEHNKALAIVAVIFIEFIFLMLIFIGLSNQNIDLKSDSITLLVDRVESYGVEKRIGGSKEHTPVEAGKSFFIKLASQENKIGVYRANGNYKDLYKVCRENDTLRVHFKPNKNKRESINIDIVQIEDKNGVVLLDKSEFENKMSSLIWIGLIGMIVLPILVYRQFKKRLTIFTIILIGIIALPVWISQQFKKKTRKK